MSRTGVLGGTFDPPHAAHLALAGAARAVLHLDRVIVVPAGDPWRKASRKVTAAADRLAMTQAAFAALPWVEVSTVEVDRSGPSYTAETLETLTAPGGEWWFILGADALEDMAHWHEPRRICAAARLAVAVRPGSPSPSPSEALRALVPGINERIDLVPMTPVDLSSTGLRERLAAAMRHTPGGAAPDVEVLERAMTGRVPRAVLQVVVERQLYAGD